MANMHGHYIAAVARIAGLSADSIRSWERRYGLVRPQRDAAGLRVYTDAEVTRLKLARQATELGHPIRKVATLDDEAIAALVQGSPSALSTAGDFSSPEKIASAMLDALRAGDSQRLKRTVASAVMLVEPQELVLRIFVPLLREVGTLWHEGRLSVWQEHLLSELVGSATGVFTRIAERPSPDGGFLFATPPSDQHVFGIAFAAMLTSSRGLRTHNLGVGVPASELVAAAKALEAHCVVVGVTGPNGAVADLVGYLDELDRMLPRGVEIWVGGSASVQLVERASGKRIRAVPTLEAFAEAIAAVP